MDCDGPCLKENSSTSLDAAREKPSAIVTARLSAVVSVTLKFDMFVVKRDGDRCL